MNLWFLFLKRILICYTKYGRPRCEGGLRMSKLPCHLPMADLVGNVYMVANPDISIIILK